MAEKQPTTPGKQQRETGTQRPPGSGATFWWMVFLALLIWNAALFWPSPKPEALIPYSSFLEQVRAGNVSEVLISGPQISGTFAKPVLWPESTATGAASQPEKAETATSPGSENASGTKAGKNRILASLVQFRKNMPTLPRYFPNPWGTRPCCRSLSLIMSPSMQKCPPNRGFSPCSWTGDRCSCSFFTSYGWAARP